MADILDRLKAALANRYTIERELGSGGMATVYLAQDLKHHRKVAVKVLRPDLAAALGPERFLREIDIAANLTHPHIVPLYDSGEADGFLFYVMPYVEGESLRSRISREKQLSIDDSIKIAGEIADALDFAHEHKVIHRDIKPENILFEARHAVVADFGVARAITAAGETRLTDTGIAVGTPDYMAPEQVEGGEADGRSDIYALGITLYEMLTGRVPFEGDTPLNVAMKHMTEEPEDPIELNDQISEDLSGVVLKCLEKGKQERFQTAEELLSELSNIEQGLPLTKAVRKRELPGFLSEEEGESVEEERPAFVAREEELSKLDEFLEIALEGQGRVVFIKGVAGSGKTALIHEFARLAQEALPDLIVAGGNCNAHTGIGDPYLPFREVLALLTGDVEGRWRAGSINRDHARRLWECLPVMAESLVESGPDLIDTFIEGRELSARSRASSGRSSDWIRNLRELVDRKAAAPPDSTLQQSVLLEQYARVLEALADQKPVLLLLDDLQWADAGSISLLTHLVNRIQGRRVLIAGAYRSEEVALDRGGERHPLKPVIGECRASFGNIEVEVGTARKREFVDAILDMEPNRFSGSFHESFLKHTEGHSLFTIEVLRGLKEQGALVQDTEGFWTERDVDWTTLPARVEAMIGERIERMPEDLREILKVASVEGEYFTGEVLAAVEEVNERETVRLLSGELDKRYQLVKAQGFRRIDGQRLSQYRFAHILFQKYLYNSLDEVERAHLHEDVGNVLERLYGERSGDIAVQLARHFEESGITAKAVAYLQQAGMRSHLMSANEEAIAHFTKALELLTTLPETPELLQQELALQIGLCQALMVIKGPSVPEALAACARAYQLCQQAGETPQLVQALFYLTTFYACGGELDKAIDLANQMLTLSVRFGDHVQLAVSHWELGWVQYNAGEFVKARGNLEQSLAYFAQQESPDMVFVLGLPEVAALTWLTNSLWCLGYAEQALQRSRETVSLADKLGHEYIKAFALSFAVGLFHVDRRELLEGRESIEEAIRLSRENGYPMMLGAATYLRGFTESETDPARGLAQIRDGIAIDQLGLHTNRDTLLAEVQSRVGDVDGGLKTLEEALAHVEKSGERSHEADIHRLKGELLLMKPGPEAEAETSIHKAIEVAQRQQAKSWELRATMSLARLWQKQNKADEARHRLAEVYGWFTEGFDTPDLKDAKVLLAELDKAS